MHPEVPFNNLMAQMWGSLSAGSLQPLQWWSQLWGATRPKGQPPRQPVFHGRSWQGLKALAVWAPSGTQSFPGSQLRLCLSSQLHSRAEKAEPHPGPNHHSSRVPKKVRSLTQAKWVCYAKARALVIKKGDPGTWNRDFQVGAPEILNSQLPRNSESEAGPPSWYRC